MWLWREGLGYSLWKGCLHGSTLTSSPSTNSSRQTLQSVIWLARTVSAAIVMVGNLATSMRASSIPGPRCCARPARRACSRVRRHCWVRLIRKQQQQQNIAGRSTVIARAAGGNAPDMPAPPPEVEGVDPAPVSSLTHCPEYLHCSVALSHT